jgi:hypothetical protein
LVVEDKDMVPSQINGKDVNEWQSTILFLLTFYTV